MSLVPFVHVDASLEGARAGDHVALSADEAHHLTTVLRLEPGAPVEVADGRGRRAGARMGARHVVLDAAPATQQRPRPSLTVAQALPKGRKLDEVVRHLTELNVDALIPLATQRCVVRLVGPKATRATDRWIAVARAASEQARRSHRPTIEPVTSLTALTALAREEGTVVLVAHPGSPGLDAHVPRCRAAARVVLVVGPEGGLTDGEMAVLTSAGAHPVGLGPTVLRTEHAAAAAVAALACALGRWS